MGAGDDRAHRAGCEGIAASVRPRRSCSRSASRSSCASPASRSPAPTARSRSRGRHRERGTSSRRRSRSSPRAGTSSTGGWSRRTGARRGARTRSRSGRIPGRSPRSRFPPVEESAATPRVVVTSWLALLAALAAIGLVVGWILAGPRRALGRAFAAASVAALVLTPLSVLFATAQFALRSAFDLGALVPLLDDSALGRGVLAFALCFALFVVAGAIALRTGRRARRLRGARARRGVALALPGHPRPRGRAHGARRLAVPRRRCGAARRSVAALLARGPATRRGRASRALARVRRLAGIAVALLDRPPDGSWDTVVRQRAGRRVRPAPRALLVVGNRPRARERTTSAPRGRRSLPCSCAGTLLVSVVAAQRRAARERRSARGGERAASARARSCRPSRRTATASSSRVDPNRAGGRRTGSSCAITKDGTPVTDADVSVAFSMLEMEMGQQDYELPETAPGVYGRDGAGARDGRPLGARVRGRSRSWEAVHGAVRGRGDGLSREPLDDGQRRPLVSRRWFRR